MELTAENKYQLLLEISHKVRDTLELNEILDHLLDTVKSVIDYDAAGIFVLNQDLVHNRYVAPIGLIAGVSRRGFPIRPVTEDEMLTYGRGIVGFVIQNCQSMVAPDVRQHPLYYEGRKHTLSEIAVPIIRNDRAVGALNLESDHLAAYTDYDLEVLQFFADAAAISIEKAMLHRQQMEKERLDRQLLMAREVQSRLIPESAPIIPGFEIAGIFKPTQEIGGDYFDYIPLSKARFALAIADVSGHGIAPALVMTAFRALLRMQARRNIKPSRVAGVINRLLPEFTGESHFITMVYALLDPDSPKIQYVNCGHPPPIIIRQNRQIEMTTAKGLALGILPNTIYTQAEISLYPGDIMVFYTDGVVEQRSRDSSYPDVDKLGAIVEKWSSLDVENLAQRIYQEIQDLSGLQLPLDDFTLLVIRRT